MLALAGLVALDIRKKVNPQLLDFSFFHSLLLFLYAANLSFERLLLRSKKIRAKKLFRIEDTMTQTFTLSIVYF